MHGGGREGGGLGALRKMNEKYRVRGNEIGYMGQRRKVGAREMSKYKNKQGSQGQWERVEIDQQFGIRKHNRIVPAIYMSVPLTLALVWIRFLIGSNWTEIKLKEIKQY